MKFKFGNTFLSVVLLIFSNWAWALGLGDARVESFIGQPLEMRIELLTSPSDDIDSVTARLASAEDFALIGASRGAINVPLSFNVREDDAGRAYILVSSRQPLNDPVMRLVVEVNWASGRLLREYTVFLDPPTVPARAPQPVTPAPEPAGPVAAEEPPPVAVSGDTAPAQPAPAQPAPAPAATASEEPPRAEPTEQQQTSGADRYGPVRTGDTLWGIASDYASQASLDINQAMIAIQRRNPGAFVNDNINLLMRGAVLEMPSQEEVNQITRRRAQEMVAQQEAAFRMRSSLASSSTPLLAAESAVEAPDAEVADGGPDEPAPVVSRLEIVPASDEDLAAAEPGTGAVPGGEGAEEVSGDLREALARTEEELISERQQNEYLRERIDELEAQLAEAEGETGAGIVPDEELANLQERLQAERLDAVEAGEEATQPEAVPTVTTSTPASGKAWYSKPMTWVIMIFILVTAVAGWLFNRRRGEEFVLEESAKAAETVAGLKGEAEEILRALDSDVARQEEEHQDAVTFVNDPDPGVDDLEPRPEASVAGEDIGAGPGASESGSAEEPEFEPRVPSEDETGDETEDLPEDEPEDEPDFGPDSPVIPLSRARRQDEESGDATFLDESSSDPEIKLDLARAYISMGDKEAARVILEEVLGMGSEAQQSEARSMLDSL